MRDPLSFTLYSNRFRRLMIVGLVVILSLICCTSCATPVSDPALEIVSRALQSDADNPDAAYAAVQSNLNSVKDKQIIPVLLDYLNKDRHRQTGYPGILREVVFYLEGISGIKSHAKLLSGNPYYMNVQDADKDIEQWQTWWNANKDYVNWDDQSQMLKVTLH